jgi:hypothetical protein
MLLALAACTPQPAKAPLPPGVFLKTALLGRPLAAVSSQPEVLAGLLQAPASLPSALIGGFAADAVAFDISEKTLTVVAAANGAALAPVAHFTIKRHFDSTPHARWQEREYVEVGL